MYKTLLIPGLFLIYACGSPEQKVQQPENAQLSSVDVEWVTAQEIVENVCFSCHHPTSRPDNRLAPPLEIAKRNYLASNPDRESFIDAMTTFVMAPTPEQAKLHSDVENFGVMDPLGYSEEQIREVAAFIYDNELTKPDWLE